MKQNEALLRLVLKYMDNDTITVEQIESCMTEREREVYNKAVEDYNAIETSQVAASVKANIVTMYCNELLSQIEHVAGCFEV